MNSNSATDLVKDLVCANTERKEFIKNMIWKHTGTFSADKIWSLLPTRWDLKPVFQANQSAHSASLISSHAIILPLALFTRGWGLGMLEIYSFCFPAWKYSDVGKSVGKSAMVSYFTARHDTATYFGLKMISVSHTFVRMPSQLTWQVKSCLMTVDGIPFVHYLCHWP